MRANISPQKLQYTSAARANTHAVFSGAYWTIDDYWRCNAWIWCTKEMIYKEKAP